MFFNERSYVVKKLPQKLLEICYLVSLVKCEIHTLFIPVLYSDKNYIFNGLST